MSLKLAKSPIWVTALIVGLVAATALVAGYVDRPGTGSEVSAADAKCADCPKEGTSECCKATGTCSEKSGCADGGCSSGTCAKQASADAPATCAATSGCAAKAASSGTCAASGEKVAGSGCGGGQCAVGK